MTSHPDPATRLRRAVERCVRRKHFPGAVYLVARGDAVLSWEAVGRTSPLRGQGRPMTLDTVFDLASVTKPIATASLFLQLMAERSLRKIGSERRASKSFCSTCRGFRRGIRFTFMGGAGARICAC
jgi:hypothetical protein